MSRELVLPSELTIYSVAELRRQLLSHVDAHAEDDACRIDAAGVDQVDAAGLQLLMSLALMLAPLGRTLQLAHASPALCAACDLLGLSAHLLNPCVERALA
jgi:anti-anti-sigma regulatory factor